MSTNLYYYIPEQRKPLSFDLKRAISQKYWQNDGSVYGGLVQLDLNDITYFQGLSDAGIEDADKIIKLIEKHRILEITIDE